MYERVSDLKAHRLGGTADFFSGRIPDNLTLADAEFDLLWNLHPSEFPAIHIHGRSVRIPRWQQAYGADYHFSGRTSRALAVPEILMPMWTWVRETLEPRANGLLLNWYDGDQAHYIGAHRDSIRNMCSGAPIVTVSLGAARTFRLRRWKGTERHDFLAKGGSIFILPYDTNRTWTHEVLHRRGDTGRRISVTLRAFTSDSSSGTRQEQRRGTRAL
jgi:alkylated DNA repair dioxygenase AlkB